MRYGSARNKFFLRLFIGVAFVVVGLAFHLVVTFAVGLVALAVAAYSWFGRGGGNGRPW
ncbi:MAG TPA: hypothetical protein VH089_04085 [Streptosporangiaceae bacterium]|jgi:hypothetical protein|nr:hypothetical protein [Streptosporangiaceae bacterium]